MTLSFDCLCAFRSSRLSDEQTASAVIRMQMHAATPNVTDFKHKQAILISADVL